MKARQRHPISLQDAHELKQFVKNLESRRITTAEFKSALMILRQYCDKSSALLEWAHSVAHKKRDKGITFDAGHGLWIEKFQIDAYFAADCPQLRKIPAPIFENLLALIADSRFKFDGVDMESQYPGGYSKEEIIASIKFMYHKHPETDVYKFIKAPAENVQDLELMGHYITRLKSLDWCDKPVFQLDLILDEIARTLNRLIKSSTKAVKRKYDLLALHFLAAFHLTEVDLKLPSKGSKVRCFLTVDSTLSGHLSLNLGLYKRDNGKLDAVELPPANRRERFAGSHCYTRPFLLTDLPERKYFLNGNGSEVSFFSAIRVKSNKNGPCLLEPAVFGK